MTMQVPECFQAPSGAFDVAEVESFFAGRRAALLYDGKGEPEPLIPLSKMPLVVQARWRQYLAEKASKRRALNGVTMSSGKLALRGGPAKALATVTETVTALPEASRSVTETVTPVTFIETTVTETVTERDAERDADKKALSDAERARAYRERQKALKGE